ncbi:MAG: hypothetical protein KJ072_15930, partial [Verrucomicrobia bacterium]|nr:hypothetical protein [Verrucomicrobiota bacterium]
MKGILGACIALVPLALAQASEPGRLSLDPPDARGWPRVSSESVSNHVVRIESSTDLNVWREIGLSHTRFQAFPDPTAAGHLQRFYRGSFAPRLDSDDWKNQVFYPDDPLRSPEPGYGRQDPRWIKFAMVLDEPHRVYFQDSDRYRFHYEFAVARLERFRELSRTEFDAVSLYRANQQVVLGAVLFAGSPNLQELAVQIVGLEPYPIEQVADWIELVRSVIVMPATAKLFYFPTYEQAPAAHAGLGYLASRGIEVASASRWAWTDECYSTGWTLGRLVFAPAAELAAYYADGRLRPEDVLLIDTVPAAVPPVAGIISLTPATPNSHAAILAQSFGIPFVYFADATARDRLQTWNGHEVLLRADNSFWGVQVKAVNVEGQLDPALRAALLDLKAPPQLEIPPLTRAGTIRLPADDLWPADIRYVGGKAAHFGLLRRAIPDHSPAPALAFTFDLWEDYLDQPLPGGGTLREFIAGQLGEFSWPPDMARLQTALATIRATIRDVADFPPATRQAIIDALVDAGFTTDRKIRFRSSTNVEDSEQFSGAGLYDSYSGCLGDDLFPDDGGPSGCDPAEPRKRGVFRALRRVYASFYNDHAFLERLRHGLDESQVGMAVLVHYSFPDAFELANGVATLAINQASVPSQRWVDAQLVTQLGAVSVANPDGNALPELVTASAYSFGGPWLDLKRHSSLVPLGATVLGWEDEYRQLYALLDQSARAYEAAFPTKRQLTLDFEYKKEAPANALSIKQIRAVPRPPDPGPTVPWLLNETNRYTVLQGELGDLFAFHRLKSTWTIQTANLRLESTHLAETFLRQLEAEFLLDRTVTHLEDDVRHLPNHKFQRDGDTTVDRWTTGSGAERRDFELHISLPTELPAPQSPVVFLSDGRVELAVTYPTPQPLLDYSGFTNTLTDRVTLAPVDPVGPLSLLQTRRIEDRKITVETIFYWPPTPTGPVAGYTAPLQGWVQTTITGLLPQPLVLQGDYAQTYHPGHHNFY